MLGGAIAPDRVNITLKVIFEKLQCDKSELDQTFLLLKDLKVLFKVFSVKVIVQDLKDIFSLVCKVLIQD